MKRRRGWLAGSVVLGIALGAAIMAVGFRVSFPTDPLGPRAFPLVAALLLAIGALSLWRPAETAPSWPDRAASVRIGLASLSFVAYALALAPLGFIASTAAEFALLAVLFGGSFLRSAAAGTSAALLLYALFVYGLGLPLPLGLFAL